MQGKKQFTEKLFTNFQLSERVPADNFYRRLKQVLDIQWLYKATKKYYGSEGQKSIDPVVFFKLMLIGYLENPGSDRRIITTVSTVEPVLGTLVNYLSMRRVNTRGIKQANKCMLLAAIAYNLKKLMKLNERKVEAAVMMMKKAEKSLCFLFSMLWQLTSLDNRLQANILFSKC